MIIEITHSKDSPPTKWTEEKEFPSMSEAKRYCMQHSTRIEFLMISNVIPQEKYNV